jgi:dTDP-4-dehydrorhamnose reductase
MSRILVTGASGLLGLSFGLQYCDQHEIIGIANEHPLQGLPFELRQVDLAQPDAAQKLVAELRPEIVLHCAALANIDRAESHPALAQRINAQVPGEFAASVRKTGGKLIHISTDSVFDGQRGDYRENDEPNPINVYARTKLAGEKAVLQANPDAIVARVNFYGWSLSGKRSLGEIFFHTLSAGKTMFGFTDVYFCPLQVNVLSEILLEMAARQLTGLYHVVSREALTKYDFGVRIARLFDLDETQIQPVSWKDAGLKAARSPNLTLKCDKLARAFGRDLPAQAPGLSRFLSLYREGFLTKISSYAV